MKQQINVSDHWLARSLSFLSVTQQPPLLGLTEDVLGIVFVIQRQHVCELVLLVHQVQPVLDHRVVLETVFPDGEHHLNHVLDPFVDGRLVQDVSEALKYGWKPRERWN